MSQVPISYPARYAPGVALNYADPAGHAVTVSQAAPLPVTLAAGGGSTSPQPPLSGTASAALTAGPFVPQAGKPLVLSLAGTWSGAVQLLRSVDGGATKLPVTLAGAPWGNYWANVCEPVWEESEAGTAFYLQLAPASGAIHYRLAQ
ncbi:MAG: hypothetical protein LC648_07500 [Novosphingobium sp.]|nr:hypothetical protein [Novosphingobium sp.]